MDRPRLGPAGRQSRDERGGRFAVFDWQTVSAGSGGAGFVPRLDALETDTEYQLTAELPGLEEKDFSLEIEDGVLTLKGEKHSRFEETGEGGKVRRIEADKARAEAAAESLKKTVVLHGDGLDARIMHEAGVRVRYVEGDAPARQHVCGDAQCS